jgi:hypothetical protein
MFTELVGNSDMESGLKGSLQYGGKGGGTVLEHEIHDAELILTHVKDHRSVCFVRF